LGGVAGGASGISEAREQRRLEEEQRQKAEEAKRQAERQAMLDIVAMADRPGWATPEQRTQSLRQAAPGLQSLAGAAGAMMRGGAPSPVNMESLQQGAGQFGAPGTRVSMGGREFMQTETPTARALREAEFSAGQDRRKMQEQTQAQLAEQERKKKALIAAGETPERAEAMVVSGVSLPQQPWKQAGFSDEASYLRYKRNEAAATRAPERAEAINWQMTTDRAGNVIQINPRTGETRRLSVDGEPLQAEEKAGGARKSGAELKGDIPLPTLTSNLKRLRAMSDKDVTSLSPFSVYNAVQAPLLMSKSDGVGYVMGGFANWASDEKAREYATIVRAATDAVARASEVGVLTNQDIARYQGQVTPLPGDTPKDQRRKHRNLVMWTEWLANNKQAIESGDSTQFTSQPPDDLVEDYPFAKQFIDNARAQGESEAEIRKFLEAQQGRRR
jgi:hypothetical protein